MQTILAI